MFGSISQKALHARAFRFGDNYSAKVSLFPLFDDRGQTKAFMLTNTLDGRIFVLPYSREMFVRGRKLLFESHHLRRRWSEQSNADLESADLVSDLWHYDPWWELGDSRYGGHPLVPVLKATNVPGYTTPITGLWFSRKLDRVTMVALGKGDKRVIRGFKPKHLEAARQERNHSAGARERTPRADRHREWRLRPFWQR